MSLSEATVRTLADRVADLIRSWLPQTAVGVRVDSSLGWGLAGTMDPAWTVYFDVGPDRSDSVSVWVPKDDDPSWALFRLVDALDEISETSTSWGGAFPRCLAGHSHPAEVRDESGGVVLRCPRTGEIANRIPLPAG